MFVGQIYALFCSFTLCLNVKSLVDFCRKGYFYKPLFLEQ